jgi:hypothetical protein
MGHVLSSRSIGKHPRVALSVLTTGLTIDTSFIFEGEFLIDYLLECFNESGNTPARSISIIDENSVVVYAGPTHSNNGNYLYGPTGGIPLDGKYTVRETLSGGASGGSAGTSGTDHLTLFVI